jgi:hypothetical protein
MKNFLLIVAIFLSSTLVAYAADVSIVAPNKIESTGQFSVLVNLNSGGVSVNSMDITIEYPKELFVFKGYKEDGGIKKLWLQTPKDDGGKIHFSGIIPGGVEGLYDPDKVGLQPIPITELLFSPKINGTGEFTISDSSILQNDGLGTPLGHVRNNATTLINIPEDQKINLTENSSGDKEPPEPFVVEYIPSGFFSKTPSMISFFTTDTISGVEKYQIKDSHSYWKDVVSPFEISKGIVKRSIIVRALDFNGNIRESSVEIPGLLSSLQLLGVFIILISCYFLFFVVKRKR